MDKTKQILDSIITFKGEFPRTLLASFLEIAYELAPYDECAYSEDGELDAPALFELLELQNVLKAELGQTIAHVANNVTKYLYSLYNTRSPKVTQWLHSVKRMMRSVNRMHGDLIRADYRLVAAMLAEVSVAMNCMMITDMTTKLRLSPTQILEMRQGPQHDTDLGWYVLAERFKRQSPNLPTLGENRPVRKLLGTVDLDLPIGVPIPLKYQPGDSTRMAIVLTHAKQALSLAQVNIVDVATTTLIATGEVTRKGEICFENCYLLMTWTAFNRYGLTALYSQLRDMIFQSIYEMLLEGSLQERVYISIEDSEEDPMDPADPDPIDEVPEQAERLVNVSPPQAAMHPEHDAEKSPIVGYGRFSYRNILATLLRFGVTFDRSGKHVKLRRGDATTGFLNRHASENPRHNKAVLRRALRRLGIDKRQFFLALAN